jgi:Methyltransferase domain
MRDRNLKKMLVSQIKRQPRLVELLRRAADRVSPETMPLDYPVNSRPRWDREHPHRALHDVINKNREAYKSELQAFLALSSNFTSIPERQTRGLASHEPYWINGWIPALDGVALYGFMVTRKPKLYIEVGSGNSTKFAHKAIVDHHLDTKIVSIDPSPRAEINPICDVVIREPVEEIDVQLFDPLDANDILFIDNSHRVFMNSDATTMFLDVLPRLRPGVLVEIHDITLPYDYPAEWAGRYYSEQYLLAAYLLAKGSLFDVLLPNVFISDDRELNAVLAPLWQRKELKNVEPHGASFWLRMN